MGAEQCNTSPLPEGAESEMHSASLVSRGMAEKWVEESNISDTEKYLANQHINDSLKPNSENEEGLFDAQEIWKLQEIIRGECKDDLYDFRKTLDKPLSSPEKIKEKDGTDLDKQQARKKAYENNEPKRFDDEIYAIYSKEARQAAAVICEAFNKIGTGKLYSDHSLVAIQIHESALKGDAVGSSGDFGLMQNTEDAVSEIFRILKIKKHIVNLNNIPELTLGLIKEVLIMSLKDKNLNRSIGKLFLHLSSIVGKLEVTDTSSDKEKLMSKKDIFKRAHALQNAGLTRVMGKTFNELPTKYQDYGNVVYQYTQNLNIIEEIRPELSLQMRADIVHHFSPYKGDITEEDIKKLYEQLS